jgi:NAD(P)H-flavin reductase
MAETSILPVRSLTAMTPRTQLLTLDATGGPFAFRAGQAVWLRRPGAAERKPYSIASAPADLGRGVLEFLIALEEDGRPGPHLGDLHEGSPIELEGPLGGFDLPPSVPHAPVLLVGGGTGIAPLRSMWRQLRAGGPDGARVSLIYSARRSDEVAFLDELTQLAHEGRMRVGITITGEDADWSSLRGRVTADMLAAHLEAPGETRCAVCGPMAFVAHVGQALLRLGVPPAHIATERW